ncbi:PREDICTED: ATPase family AAA domain-containing protein At1g05910 [Lupinus angustifolius]|uniref:ATPase family AAA domain-containing protein At1g05910 n=1 Tax=Lupinus angustifolius TaxID=3871 RepID=UPI00092F8ABE|nr:PREDICTED: ATPase family AAA domain-containing protein At1g05910 [Lupinus angustifolius]XP_019413437.1 PREDICTED: ATPase family AAA domain-containing protein At1g05910 [Lupinus angustifolius]
MYPKRSSQDGPGSGQVRTSDRIRTRPNIYGRPFSYYNSNIRRTRKSKNKTRTAASQIAKMLRPGNHRGQDSNTNSGSTNLRRSTRKRMINKNLEDFTDSSGHEDDDLMRPQYRTLRNRVRNSVTRDDLMSTKHKRTVQTKPEPRREGLRPRRSRAAAREQLILESDDEQDLSEDKGEQDESENGNDVEENDADDGQNEIEGDGEGEDGEDEGDEDGDDEEGEEEQDGRRRYDLRNRADVRRFSMEEGKARPRSPRRVLHQGMGTKVSRDVRKGSTRVHKRHRLARPEDSDDSLLVDELDQGPAIPWGRSGSRSGPPLAFGGLDMHGSTSWGLNLAASGWGHQGDSLTTLTSGIQTAGPSSKGGADIQPLQVDDSVSFSDIGGLSEYVDALKEMVFFPLLYPDFFASYHITPPRGVLLCGPPGTGKTLIARALACAASKAGQKVSFYMRKGADVLSKWVGEAERQLKLLFEEAQRNQPSIIFFDEIDGLAPVRSSKQEQIHNSIVSTLLALMDGLDSRGQVVLIGATNRIDAIDGALRRPGRFDREFNFSLPGCEARAEILDIHTRKWMHPPSNDLKKELAASCVGYCGADLKALCTEAAIRAFRQKYPQVYTSDDKFLIDVDSVRVHKYHFIEAMSTITPAAHRGAIVHSRPLSLVVQPCLQRHLEKAMNIISDIFPSATLASELTKLSMLSYGSAIPLVYRPRLLLCGGEGTGLDHLGPAVLHELEKFPVHSLGLPSLLADPSAKTPEEALVHIFGEARRTTPSILYLPQFDVWWETAHEQLRAVLLTLLEELPSDLPILLLGTSSVALAEVEEVPTSIFPHRSIYQAILPTTEDRTLFFDRMIEAVMSVLLEGMSKKSQDTGCIPELPKAPKLASGPKVSELKAKVEAEQHALRRLRMCLRDVCNRILYDKRFNAFHYPVSDEDAPNYRLIIQNPMDMATVLQHVDNGHYITCAAFLQDIDLIVSNAKAYNGDDYNGARIVSRACELRDAVHGMLSQMDPALVAYCDKIASQGGPANLPDELRDSTFPATPVVQLGTATRMSARLRNVQPDVNVDRSYEALKRTKKNTDVVQAADKSQEDSVLLKSADEHQANNIESERIEPVLVDGNSHGTCTSSQSDDGNLEDVIMQDGEFSRQVDSVKELFVKRSENHNIPQLERLYMRVMKGVFEAKGKGNSGDLKHSVLDFLLKFVEDDANF